MPFRNLRIVCFSIMICLCSTIILADGKTGINPELSPSWIAETMRLQREIDLNAPLREATFLGTHNSYNSRAYEIPFIRYVDPNHTLSIYDQLETGARSIELDAHWTMTKSFSKAILLCHGQANHTGCGLFDRNITEGLTELKNWLKSHPDEIVLLYIERHLDGHEPRLASDLEQYLGSFIFKPAAIRPDNAKPGSCVSLPTKLTKADILQSGKQLIVMVRGCDGDNPRYEEQDKYKQIWNNLVFAGAGQMKTHEFDWYESRIEEFKPYPDCSKSSLFSSDADHNNLWRIFEDRTLLSSVISRPKKLEANDMRELIRCGINWPTMDMLSHDDPRLQATLWSWAPEYPQNEGGQCAKYESGTGIKNIDCEENLTSFACKDTTSGKWAIVNATGPWSYGNSICASLGSKSWRFSTPINGSQMEALKFAMSNQGVYTAGLNYREITPRHWSAG